MTRLILAGLFISHLVSATALAWDMPYGVQDPMGSGRFAMCQGGEIGFWNVVQQKSSDGTTTTVFLALTSVDLIDPAYVICLVPPDRKLLVMEPGKAL